LKGRFGAPFDLCFPVSARTEKARTEKFALKTKSVILSEAKDLLSDADSRL
jgi:hypothetical protein